MKVYLVSAPVILATAPGGIQQASAQSAQATLQECMAGWTQLGFNPLDFERFPDVFRADSTITLAQAGIYTGPDAIEEYVRFASPTSPYIAEIDEYREPGLKGIDGNICIFSAYGAYNYHLNGDLVGEDPPSIKTGIISHFYFNVAEGYIPRWDVYYSTPFLQYFFGVLNSPGVLDFVCSTMKNACGFDVDVDGACQDRLAGLPVVTGVDYADGNDFGCRALHGVFAATNTDHCAHISFEPREDLQGKVKCQESAGLQPSDFFDEEDLTKFKDFCDENGIDPNLGYRVLAPTAAPATATTAAPTTATTAAPTTPATADPDAGGKSGKGGKSVVKAVKASKASKSVKAAKTT